MMEDFALEIRDIFVGRESELKTLTKLLAVACKNEEHLLYVLLNAPGVGKTTLIQHFGKIMEEKRNGLYIRLICSSNKDSPRKINRLILRHVERMVHEKEEFIKEYVQKSKEEDRGWLESRFDEFKTLMAEKKAKDSLTIDDPIELLSSLSEVIPLFIATDEIQEFQKVSFKNPMGEEETALHYYTRILKDLINERILLILSGTRYHILSQIGTKIGSPIREKVHPIVLGNFNVNEINEYVVQVKLLIKNSYESRIVNALVLIMEQYHRFLLAFSRGHPRTIERVTIEFFNQLPLFLREPRFKEYESFMVSLLPLTIQAIQGSLLTKDKEDAALDLRNHALFGKVKEWIVKRSHGGLLLGHPPGFGQITEEADEIRSIIYDLMNLGFIVQNGSSNYHLTSYYHLLAFLKPFQEEKEAFLKEILYNKFFRLMCGSHSGFGYTFENVLSASFLMYGQRESNVERAPINFSRIKGLRSLQGHIDWKSLSIESDILCQTPQARAVDAFILQDEKLVLMQFTTANPPDPKKLDVLGSIMEKIERHSVLGWLVSLFPLPRVSGINENITITSGKNLSEFLGESLTNRLLEVKKSL